MSERHFRRLRDRYEAQGAEGLIDRRRGRVSGRRVAVDRIEWLLEQYRTRYFDFTVKHFHERLRAEHKFALGYSWTKRILQDAGLVKRAPKRSAHRKKRPRRPLPGMMLFQDGSTHAWLAGRPALDLIVTLDDATSELYSAFLVEEEGTFSSLRGLTEVIGRHGLFCSLYTDRGSHYFVTRKAGGKMTGAADPGRARPRAARHRAYPVLFARGARPHGAGLRHAAEPAAAGAAPGRDRDAGGGQPLPRQALRGRAQRPLRGRRDRARQRLRGLRGRSGRGFVRSGRARGRERQLRALRGPRCTSPHRHRHHFVKIKVRVHAYEDGRLAVFHGPRCLARYQPDGRLAEVEATIKPAA